MAQFFNFKEDYYGLTAADVEKRLATYGENIFTKNTNNDGFSYLRLFLSPSVIIMFTAGVLAFFAMGIAAGIVTILFDAFYCAAEIYFQKSADKSLCEIKQTLKMKIRVIRDGKVELVDNVQIVPEDIIVLQEGERVPVDAFILESKNLTCDESVFSGKSAPVAKYSGAISHSELKPTFVYAQTTVLSGNAVCKVVATGVDTKFYQHKGELPERSPYLTGFEKILRTLIPASSIIALLITLLTIIVGFIGGNGIIPSALGGLTLGMCFLPTGLSSIIRLYYVSASSEMLKCGAVIKSYNDIEKLNSMSVLCVEKEGAISKNNLEVRGIYAQSEELLYKVAALACDRNTTNPAERALMGKASFFDEHFSDIYSEYDFIEKIPDGDSISGALWSVGGDRIYCIKGVPEQILPMCRLSGERLMSTQKRCQEYYEKGCNIIAFACVEAKEEELDKTVGFSYTFVGFAAFSAPLRDSASKAVQICQNTGVRVVMLCDDSADTAAATAKMVGISADKIVTGRELSSANADELDFSGNVFAEISTEQKSEIISRLKSEGAVVGMAGTCVFDTEPLRTADIGFTIAEHCSPSVREAADIVMNNDNFLSIADAIADARQVHRNIKRAFSLIVSGYVAFLAVMFVNLLFDEELMLNPPIMSLFTMILLPVLAISYVGGKYDMDLPMPSSDFISHRKFNYRYLIETALIGFATGAVTAVSYALMYNNTTAAAAQGSARSCGLITLMICTAAFALVRYSSQNPFKAFVKSSLFSKVSLLSTAALPFLLVFIPVINGVFGLLPIDLFEVLISVVLGIIPAAVMFLVKYFLGFKEL